ncbi:hypothetical protein Q3G72_019288 [Acer saccharum]|nr:hypothetical protein Q3G72_019288 [Acer saccharum]
MLWSGEKGRVERWAVEVRSYGVPDGSRGLAEKGLDGGAWQRQGRTVGGGCGGGPAQLSAGRQQRFSGGREDGRTVGAPGGQMTVAQRQQRLVGRMAAPSGGGGGVGQTTVVRRRQLGGGVKKKSYLIKYYN